MWLLPDVVFDFMIVCHYRFEVVQKLQKALLMVSFLAALFFFIALYKPYITKLNNNREALVGMLSQLPPEVDVEAHLRAVLMEMKQSMSGHRAL